ncbi:MAG: GNAT family N-acetyltransferase [Myxococcota bacterium]
MFEWGETLPTLTGTRLQLRGLTDDDAAAIFEIFGDPEVMKYWSSPPLESLAAASALIEDIHRLAESRELFQWGIVSLESNVVIGTCTLQKVDHLHRRTEIGFALGRSAWGNGFATEAVGTLFEFAFQVLDLNRIEADVDPHNEASLRLLERQGFRREGYLRERWFHLGEMQDTVLLGLLRRDWPGKRE